MPSSPHAEALQDLATRVVRGKMSRRTFFERSIALGVSTSAAASILAACGSSTPAASGPVTLTLWHALAQPEPILAQMYVDFHTANPNLTIQSTYYSYGD